MHTSTLIKTEDFEYFQRGHDGEPFVTCEFDACFPNYHDQDRVGVVSMPFENAPLYTGFALLACGNAFYDAHRARGGVFFDYPQHYFFYECDDEGLNTSVGRRHVAKDERGCVGHLDVWPENKRVATPPGVLAMITMAFDYNINRLFWPYGYGLDKVDKKLPWYFRSMMRTRMKSVYYYNSPLPNMQIRGTASPEKLVWETIGQLSRVTDPPPDRDGPGAIAHDTEAYEQVSVDDFLDSIDSAFEPTPQGKPK
tara:strand:- start:293 stop:1051 length:759 start_codon:yes stop_codon:yes gene_type:complete